MDEISINPRATLRTRHDEAAYTQAKINGELNRLSDEPSIYDYVHWRVIQNRYPYSVAFKRHHLLLPKRMVANETELTVEEITDLREIKKTINYDIIMENLGQSRSVLDHYHVHLLSYYDSRSEMAL